MANGTATSELAGRILKKCKELNALKFGEFTLASGQISKYYFDGRLLTLSPEGANLVAQALLPLVREAGASAVGGPAVAAVPMVTELAMLSGQDGGPPIDGFFVRAQAKDHGMGKTIEGPVQQGVPVVIVDDACSTASSLYLAIEAAEADGHEIVMVACILDRNQGGSERLRKDGYNFVALLEGDSGGNVTVVSDVR